MAVSIVPAPDGRTPAAEITKGSRWYCDHYTGTPAALIAAGHISPEHITPQAGRTPGRTAFLADGQPCPPGVKAWRDPGFRAIQQLDDGTYRVEVTVSKETQKLRRSQERAAEHEAEQERIKQRIAEEGHLYRNWVFRQNFERDMERWEGTKSQLQAAGLGVGLSFPGEAGAPEELVCTCPLGFKFRIFLPGSYDAARAAAGIYTAVSSYLDETDHRPRFAHYAAGVLRHEWTPESWWSSHDVYRGTADALISAGLVPALKFFPGQPGAKRVQASYRRDWSPATNANNQELAATIRRRGQHGYEVEIPASEAEVARRVALREAKKANDARQSRALADERRRLREATAPQKSAEAVKQEMVEQAKFALNMVAEFLFMPNKAGWHFDIPRGSTEYDELAEAFVTIRRVMEAAPAVRQRKHVEAAKKQLRLAAARQDGALQSMLRDASPPPAASVRTALAVGQCYARSLSAKRARSLVLMKTPPEQGGTRGSRSLRARSTVGQDTLPSPCWYTKWYTEPQKTTGTRPPLRSKSLF